MRTNEDISEYVEWQSQNKCNVLSAKPEQEFEDLGVKVRVWNVKTDLDGAWWVVEGDEIPMNLYPQEAYFFGIDEVYSFHMGIMARMQSDRDDYDPKEYIDAATVGTDIAPVLLRKLRNISTLIDLAIECEDFQAIGVQCREVLIELTNQIYLPVMAGDNEQPKGSDFKRKTELFVAFFMPGSANSDYRSIFKRMAESTWDFVNKLTHSNNATIYEVSSCVAMCIALISVFENINQKVHDPISKFSCNKCKSKKLQIIGEEHGADGFVCKLKLECQECESFLEVAL